MQLWACSVHNSLIKILLFRANNPESSTSYSRNNLFSWLYHPHKHFIGWSKQREGFGWDIARTKPFSNILTASSDQSWWSFQCLQWCFQLDVNGCSWWIVQAPHKEFVSNHEFKTHYRVDFAPSPIPVLPHIVLPSFSSLKKSLYHPNSAQPKAGKPPPSPQEEHSLSHWGFWLCTPNKTSTDTGGLSNCQGCQSPTQTGKNFQATLRTFMELQQIPAFQEFKEQAKQQCGIFVLTLHYMPG